MSQVERDFLEDQRSERKMFCEDQVDRQWLKTVTRRERELQAFERQQARARKEAEQMESVELTDELVDEVFQTIVNTESRNNDDDYDDDDYQPGEEEEVANGGKEVIPSGKRRRTFVKLGNETDETEDDMPEKYRHIRESIQLSV